MAQALVADRWILGLVLLFAGGAKLARDLASREQAVMNYDLLPRRLITPATQGLPWFEVALGMMLMLGLALSVAGGVAAVLLLGFSGAMAMNLLQGRRFNCGCGPGNTISWRLVGRNLLLTAMALAIAFGSAAALALCPGPGVTAAPVPFQSVVPVPMLVSLGLVTLQFLRLQPELVRWVAPMLARGSA